MSGRKSSEKGKRGERMAAKALTELLGTQVIRGAQNAGGPDAPDVKGLEKHGLHIEVKFDEKTLAKATYAAMNQARGDAGNELLPVVLAKRKYKDWLIIVSLQDLVELSQKILEIIGEARTSESISGSSSVMDRPVPIEKR